MMVQRWKLTKGEMYPNRGMMYPNREWYYFRSVILNGVKCNEESQTIDK
ncbi:hypothetical protein ACP3T3_10125 [Chryseobacterium sp. CBSDS_008]